MTSPPIRCETGPSRRRRKHRGPIPAEPLAGRDRSGLYRAWHRRVKTEIPAKSLQGKQCRVPKQRVFAARSRSGVFLTGGLKPFPITKRPLGGSHWNPAGDGNQQTRSELNRFRGREIQTTGDG